MVLIHQIIPITFEGTGFCKCKVEQSHFIDAHCFCKLQTTKVPICYLISAIGMYEER